MTARQGNVAAGCGSEAGRATIGLAVIGATGRVGGRLLELLPQQSAAAPQLRVVAAANSRGWFVAAEGIAATHVAARLDGSPAASGDAFAAALLRLPHPLIVIDCSASAEVAARYPDWLAAGIELVTPNKFGPSADRPLRLALAAAQAAGGTLLRDSATVGAHLPLLGTLRELRQAGDRVDSFEAVLSGTL